MRLESWFTGKDGKKVHVVTEWDVKKGQVAIKRDGAPTWMLEVGNAEELSAMLQLLVTQIRNPYRGYGVPGALEP